jgi:hypothetical protein
LYSRIQGFCVFTKLFKITLDNIYTCRAFKKEK